MTCAHKSNIYTDRHTDRHTHTDTHRHRHTHRQTHKQTDTHTHARTHARTHTHTHRNGQAHSYCRNLADLPKNGSSLPGSFHNTTILQIFIIKCQLN